MSQHIVLLFIVKLSVGQFRNRQRIQNSSRYTVLWQSLTWFSIVTLGHSYDDDPVENIQGMCHCNSHSNRNLVGPGEVTAVKKWNVS